MRINKLLTFGILGLVLIAAISLLLYIPIWQDDAEARENRVKVYELITVGQNLDDAQGRLRKAGFKLVYDEPITPTIDEDYLLQLVIVGETKPNTFESFAYAAELSWMPFTHSESAYVIINANLDGTITRIR